MESIALTVVVYFVFTIIGGIIATRFKQPSVTMLLLMGLLIGPHAFRLAGSRVITGYVVELGAILLLFIIGLEFSLKKLQKIGIKAAVIGLLKVGIVLFLVLQIGLLLGLDFSTSLILGAALSFSSTVIIIKVLEQKAMINRDEIPLLVAVLIIEDLIVVFMLAFFSSFAGKSFMDGLQETILGLVVLACVYVMLTRILKSVFRWVEKNSSEDITPFFALGLCSSMSYLAYVLRLSPTIGAFLAGSVIASMPGNKRFLSSLNPYVMMVTSMFFIAVGTMVDMRVVVDNAWIIIVLIAAVLVIRYLAIFLITSIVANFRSEQAAFFSVAMFSVGELSLLIAQVTKPYASIDIISISAAIVFISSLLMTFTLPSSQRLSSWAVVPRRFQSRMNNLSGLIKSLLEGLDTDSRASSMFKSCLSKTFKAGLASVVLVVAASATGRFLPDGAAKVVAAALALVTAYMLFNMGRHLNDAMDHLAAVYTNSCPETHMSRALSTLRALLISFLSLVAGLFMPFLLFSLGLPAWSIIFAYLLIILSAYLVIGSMSHIRIGIPAVPRKRFVRPF
ncbi:MAG: cation:proton antiporter [Nanoarchaeota archaeon]|nr:cation:proton antiporter [Nanoarchaeota archaeon]